MGSISVQERQPPDLAALSPGFAQNIYAQSGSPVGSFRSRFELSDRGPGQRWIAVKVSVWDTIQETTEGAFSKVKSVLGI